MSMLAIKSQRVKLNRKRVLVFLMLVTFAGCSDKVDVESTANDHILTVYPNPMNNAGYIWINNSSNQTGVVKVFDPKDEIILDEPVPAGPQQYQFNATDKPTGKYHVVYKVGSTIISDVLLKL